CVIELTAAVAVGQLLFLTNKESGREIVTQVIRKRDFKPTSCYVELEFTEPASGFWGVEFPEIDAKDDALKGGIPEKFEEAEPIVDDTPQAPPPDAAEVARLRQEVEALKLQLKSLTPPAEELKPASAKIEVMDPNEPKPEIAKPEEVAKS